MAEAAAETMADAAGAGREAHGASGSASSDPMHHVRDKVLFGLDARGRLVWQPYVHGKAVVGYAPAQLGPVKLEFTKHMLGITVVAALLAAILLPLGRRVLAGVRGDRPPRGRLTNLVEALLVFVRDDLVAPMGGKHVAPYTPIFLTYFFFILTCNLAGLIPEFGGPTANMAVTGALGGSVFLLLTLLGILRQGPLKYFLHMVPPGTPWPMWPLMFVLELLGPVIRCGVLCVRLFANMLAGHLVVANVLGLGVFKAGMGLGLPILGLAVGIPLALGISLLEILVCLIQAYVFTMLSVVFVGAAVHPEH